MSENKRCPFCNADRFNGEDHAQDCYFVLYAFGAPEAELDAAWNRRATQPAEVEPTEAYWAITANGQRCAFGVKSWAEGWAGKGGRVETVQLTKLALVEPVTQPASAPAEPYDSEDDGPDLTGIDIPAGDRTGNPYERLCAAWHREPCGDTLAAIGSAILALRQIYDAPLDDCLLVLQKANEFLTVPAEEAVWAGDIEGIERFAQFWKVRGAAVGAPQGQAEPTQDMLNAAMKAAVSTGLIPRHDWADTVAKRWESMKTVLTATLAAAPGNLVQGQAEPVAMTELQARRTGFGEAARQAAALTEKLGHFELAECIRSMSAPTQPTQAQQEDT